MFLHDARQQPDIYSNISEKCYCHSIIVSDMTKENNNSKKLKKFPLRKCLWKQQLPHIFRIPIRWRQDAPPLKYKKYQRRLLLNDNTNEKFSAYNLTKKKTTFVLYTW